MVKLLPDLEAVLDRFIKQVKRQPKPQKERLTLLKPMRILKLKGWREKKRQPTF